MYPTAFLFSDAIISQKNGPNQPFFFRQSLHLYV